MDRENVQETRPDESVARLEWLIEIGRSLNSTLSLHPLLNRIAVAAQELTDTEACSILLLDRKTGQLYFEAATNMAGVRSIVVPMKGSVAGAVATTGKPMVVPDVRQAHQFYRGADQQSEFSTRSILAVPMIVRGNVIGVVEAVNKRGEAEFARDDVEMLTVLSDQAAVAVQNALLFQQSDLVAEIVHEIRTPLMSIIGYAELMQQPRVTLSQCHQFASIIQRETERLNGLASDFLEFARLESGRASLSLDPVDLLTVIRMAVSVLAPQAAAKKVGLAVEALADTTTVMGDAQRLHQTMLNLIGNAIKYCDAEDRVTIRVKDADGGVAVHVADTGPGISSKALAHVFDRFYRVPGMEGQVIGSGLGLSITRRIVEAHGGEISVTSEEGRGTTFVIILPLTGPDGQA